MADSGLFNRLKKLFSTNVVIRRIGGDKLRVMDVDTNQAFADLSTNFMKTRFPGFYSTYGRYGYNELSIISTQRPVLFRDYELMETDPIIASALDIYADECVGPDTIIPLLDGSKVSIKELYDNDTKNFWVYSLDTDLNWFVPSMCEKVAYNGKKPMYKITLEDGTIFKCTSDHIWVTNEGLKSMSDLVAGSLIKAMPTKKSDNKFMLGYEMILENGKWKYTHQLIADRHNRLINEKNELKQFNLKTDDISTSYIKVVSIEYVGMEDAYDLVNVGESHVYALESNDGSKIYCHNCTTKDEFGQILSIKSDNDKIKKTLDNLFYDILNIEFNAWPWIRNMCKYGDHFLKLEISENYGIVNVIPLSPYEIEREEGFDSMNPFIVRFKNSAIYNSSNPKTDYYENYEIAHFRLLGDANFLPYGKCLSGLSVIPTNTGPKFIKDIQVGDTVYSWDNINNKTIETNVLNVVMSGIKKTYEIKTAHRRICATYEHPILTQSGYKQVKDLTLDDMVILPVINTQSDITYPNLTINDRLDSKTSYIDENLLKDNFKELVRFFGFMLGDGWLTQNTVCFSIGDRLDKSSRYIKFIEKLGLNYRFTNKNLSNSSCVVNSTHFKLILEQLGFITGTKNKKIPSWLWNLPNEYRLEMLFGFADADGCDIDENTYQLGSINEDLIDDLRNIAMLGGLSVTKKWTTINKSGMYNYWERKHDCVMHLFTYRFTSRDFKKMSDNYYVEKIRSITELEKEEVYDIQVDNEYHNFIADGIVVHNSMIESGRRVWKQLQLMEDAMLIHRIMRAPDKRIFKIDVGNVPANEVDQYMQAIVNKLKKQPLVDPRTGDYNLKYNLMNMIEDYFIPVRGGDSGTNIENVPGLTYNAIDDIEYLRNKMMAALKIPKAFLGYEEGVSGKATLAAEDVRFARTIERIQKIFVSELSKLAILHLYVQGFADDEIVDFELSMSSPSTIYEQEMISLWSEKINLIRDMKEVKLLSNDWIYRKILKLSDSEIEEQKEKVIDDAKERFRQDQIESEGNDPFKTGQTFGTPHDLALLQQTGGRMIRDIDLGATNFKVDYDRNMDDSVKDPSGNHMHYYKPDDKTKSQYDIDMAERDRKMSLRTHYGQDSHVRGRDPLGRKEYVKSYDIDRVLRPKFKGNNPLSREQVDKEKTKNLIKESLKASKFSKNPNNANDIDGIINDIDTDKNTFLDENNIIE